MTYKLELTPEQMQVLVDATDMYARVLCGQLGVVADPFFFHHNLWMKGNDPAKAHDILEHNVKPLLFPKLTPNGSLSIASSDVPEVAQVAYDIRQVISHRLAWNRTQAEESSNKFKGVWHYIPCAVSKQGLPALITDTACPCADSQCPNSQTSDKIDASPSA